MNAQIAPNDRSPRRQQIRFRSAIIPTCVLLCISAIFEGRGGSRFRCCHAFVRFPGIIRTPHRRKIPNMKSLCSQNDRHPHQSLPVDDNLYDSTCRAPSNEARSSLCRGSTDRNFFASSRDFLVDVDRFMGATGVKDVFIPTNEYDGSSATRRLFMACALLSTGAAVGMSPHELSAACASDLPWEASPVNKRSGVTVFDAERDGYNVRFVTYLSRFLICFDEDCQRWWYSRAGELPRRATADQVNSLRLKQFGAFSASVEVGLQDFRGRDGPKRLMAALLKRYCPDQDELKKSRAAQGLSPLSAAAEARQQREIKEARRQIALLFGLMQSYQPVDELTKLLAEIDNASIAKVVIQDPGSGYAPGYGVPNVSFPPPDAGSENYETAAGRVILRPSGRILRIDLINRGTGYNKPPAITISPPSAAAASEVGLSSVTASAATAKAVIFRDGVNKGKIDRIQLVDPGAGYGNETISIGIAPPDIPVKGWAVAATAEAVMELEVGGIEIVTAGTGYAAEKPLQVTVEPPPVTARVNMNDPMMAGLVSPSDPLPLSTIPTAKMRAKMPSFDDPTSASTRAEKAASRGGGGGCIGRACYDRPVVAVAYPKSEVDSYDSFRNPEDPSEVLGAEEGRQSAVRGTFRGKDSSVQTVPSWGGGSSPSSQLVSLLPDGTGLEYDTKLKRYILATTEGLENMAQRISFKPIDPEFGPRGRSPIEREKKLDLPTILRFMASGAICCSAAHFSLTPLDVVKTKVQTDPQKYPNVVSTFQTIISEEGLDTFFAGGVPTFLGFFVNGALGYTMTEYFRRLFTEFAGSAAPTLEVPIILSSAAVAGFFGCFTLAPFEAVRIRSVSQPNYAPNIAGVLNRMVKEEGPICLFNAVPVFFLKEIPFVCAKFLVFDLSTEWMYDTFPAAREDLRFSLLISLVGGTLGGIAAAFVSNPADATVSELKKAKTDMGPAEAAEALLERGGIAALFKGLGLRMFFYSLIVSLQFLIYDYVRYTLGIGSDDLKLYLDVLGGALASSGGPV